MPKNSGYIVYGAKGSGSVAVEAALTLLKIPYKLIEGATWSSETARQRVAKVNPMRQVPALVLPNGEIMTESAAILIWLADKYPKANLCPPPDHPRRAQYLRWMTYIPASIYSMYWVRDDASRLGHNEDSEAVIRHRTAERIAECWRLMDRQIKPKRYLLGDTLSVLDIYVTVVSRFTPGRKRFAKEAPKLAPIVRRVDAEPRLKKLWAERFPL